MELLIGILGAGIGSGIMAIILACLQHKWKKADCHDERMTALITAQKVLMIDRVRHLGKEYIQNGEISLEDKENINDMYHAYKGLGGNGHLETVMREIQDLKVVG